MQGQRWWRWLRGVVLGVVGLALLAPAAARGQSPAQPPGENERVVKIGPQAVVIVNERGEARMYDDPSQQAPACKTTLQCLGRALGVFGVLSYLAYEDATLGPDVNSRHVLVGSPE